VRLRAPDGFDARAAAASRGAALTAAGSATALWTAATF
jgi:hypothetical protein